MITYCAAKEMSHSFLNVYTLWDFGGISAIIGASRAFMPDAGSEVSLSVV
jgi:hypothetical protein